LESGREPQSARRQWLASLVTAKGSLELDDGAVRVLREEGKSLLPVGVRALSGKFRRGDVVLCRDPQGREIARGLSNYGSTEAARIIGHGSGRIPELLGYGGEPELIHRDNLVLL
jgi:glutamate 5-kinase